MPTLEEHYSSIADLVVDRKPWLIPGEQLRVASYDIYHKMYWSVPGVLAVKMRGENELPIYLPTARIIANTINRYVAPEFAAIPDPRLGTTAEQETMAGAFSVLFKRERFYSQFIANKLRGVQVGDACWYISANPDKPEGSRISIRPLDPATYFEIEDPEDEFRTLGCQIIDEINVGDDPALKIQTWLKPGVEVDGFVNPSSEFISYQVDVYKVEGYPDEKETLAGAIAVEEITGITNLPIYRIPNSEEVGVRWGSSEYRGLETIVAGINQSISDEDLTLAMQGLGLYWTDGGAPVDENGNETAWQLGPGEVVEVGNGNKFGRVTGVSSVAPMQEHIKYMEDRMHRVNGASDVAQGIVDVTVAESGIALKLRMAPILEAAGQKETWLIDKTDQMFFDLNEWFAAYESATFGECVMVSSVGDKLPEDKQAQFDNLLTLYQASPPLISGTTLRQRLIDMGYDIEEDELTLIVEEQVKFNEAADAFGARADEELQNDEEPAPEDGPPAEDEQ